ncbi:MAG: DNA-processing protein DprA [Candidatus Bathyarchaeia archaeon]
MEKTARSPFMSTSPQELLGRLLNEIELKYAPSKLFLSGGKSIPLPGPRVEIVGSRKASSQGILLAQELASFLARRSVIIVSGLAEGIDTAAHEAAIRQGGSTVAVLGTALDKFYPAKNSGLQNTIMRDHWAISQFPVGYPTEPKNFVIRNRTMALISDSSIIVEAGETSGSLHQGWEALRLGRPLFISKNITDNASLKWPKKMMEYGAVKLAEFEEVIDVLPSPERILQVIR